MLSAAVRFLSRETTKNLLVPVIAVTASLLICFVAIALTGRDAAEGYWKMLMGAVGGKWSIGQSMVFASVLVMTGLSVGVALRTGLFNIGAEGQFMVGAIVAAYFGWALRLPAFLHVPLIFILVIFSSGLYGAIAGYLKVKRGVHEVISTIMLNWIAVHLVESWLVVGPLGAVTLIGGETSQAGTPEIEPTARLWRPLGDLWRFDIGFFVAIAAVIGVYVLLKYTKLGFEMRAVGLGSEAARYAGIPVGRRMVQAMFASGALAGLAGALMILGTEHHYPGEFRTGYGFEGIAVSLIGANTPFGILGAGIFFGMLRAGATKLQLVEIHHSFADMIQGLAVFFIAAHLMIRHLMDRILKGRSERKGIRSEDSNAPQSSPSSPDTV